MQLFAHLNSSRVGYVLFFLSACVSSGVALLVALTVLFHVQQQPASSSLPKTPEIQPGQVTKKPEVIDDFLRNFFAKMALSRTAEAFEAEWYEAKATGRLHTGQAVPDVYQRNTVCCVDRHMSAVGAHTDTRAVPAVSGAGSCEH
jgi:hypothetical protein